MQNSSLSSERFLKKITEITETNLSDEHFGVSELAGKLGISRSNLHRKIKQLTNKSASRFICSIRLNKAFELLQQDAGSVSEVAYLVGFGSSTYFSKCFHDYFGFSPVDVKNGNNKTIPDKTKKRQRLKNEKQILILFLLSVILFFTFFSIYSSIRNSSTEKWLMIAIPDIEHTDKEVTTIINGLQYEVRNKLNQLEGFNVVSESSTIYYKKSGLNMKKLARTGIDYILLFQPITLQNTTTVYVELTETRANRILISEHFELSQLSENIFRTIENITVSLTSAIKGKISSEEEKK